MIFFFLAWHHGCSSFFLCSAHPRRALQEDTTQSILCLHRCRNRRNLHLLRIYSKNILWSGCNDSSLGREEKGHLFSFFRLSILSITVYSTHTQMKQEGEHKPTPPNGGLTHSRPLATPMHVDPFFNLFFHVSDARVNVIIRIDVLHERWTSSKKKKRTSDSVISL